MRCLRFHPPYPPALPSVTQAPDPGSAPRIERRHHRGLRLAWRLAFGGLFAAWSLLLLAWLTLQWGILPRVEQWRPQIEERASATIGMPVKIGAIRVRSGGWMPLIELDDVVLVPRGSGPSGAESEALRLPKVSATLSARSLLGLELRFEQVHVQGAALEVRRDATGRIFVAGIGISAHRDQAADEISPALDWALAQHEVAVRDGRVRWVDEQQVGTSPIELTGVDLVLRSGLTGHDVRLDATPPAAAGERFTLIGRFSRPVLARRGDWQRWSGNVYAELPSADSAAWRAYLALPFELSSGRMALRAWLDVSNGQAHSVQADVAMREIALQFKGRTQALPLESLQARLTAERDGATLRLSAERLTFRSGPIEWPATRFALALHQPAGSAPPVAGAASAMVGSFDGGEFSADRLDLAALAALAAQLPLGATVDQLLATLSPSGQVRNLSTRWEGPLDAPRRYQVKAVASALTIAAAPSPEPRRVGRPGWRNANVDFDANETGGRARLTVDKGALVFPGVFEQPEIAFDSFATTLTWRITPRTPSPAAIELVLTDTRFANADAQGELSIAQWRTGPSAGFARGARFPGQLDLSGKLGRGRAVAVARYLPLGVPEGVRRYVERAVTDGRIAEATFRVRGDLWDFPFAAPSTATSAPGASPPATSAPRGEFRIAGRVQDVGLAYVPGEPDAAPAWPAFTRVEGELIFDRGAMEIRNAQARLWGVELSKVNGGIRDLHQPVLRLDGQVRGPLADLVRYVNATPVGGWIGQALRDTTASGNSDLKLTIELPFAELSRSTVQGSLQLVGNEVRVAGGMPPLAGTKARVTFTQKTVTLTGASARVLGGDVSFEGGTQPDGSLRITGQGMATAEGLRRAGELGALSRLAASASGQTPYRLTLGVVGGHTELTLTSPMSGIALDLPAPIRKPAEATWPLRLETRVASDGQRDRVRFDLGTVISAQYQRSVSRESSPSVIRGAIGVLEPAPPLPERGVQAVLALPAVDADAWQALVDRVQSSGTAEAATAIDGYLPRVVALRAQSIVSGGRQLTNLVAGVSQDSADGTWRGSIDADQLGGYVEYRAARGPANPGRVYARLARLALPPNEASSVENLLAQAPSTVPALDVVIDNYELRGKKLGRVEVEAVNRAAEAGPRTAREWRMTRFALTSPEAQLSGSGQWQPGSGQRMVMDFKLDLSDSGAFLERLGFAGTLKGGKGRIAGQLSWAGSPLDFHVPSLDGTLNLALDAGQFLKAGPGAGRLLSVLSLQSLPRRITLDFRDLFQEGFAFDNVTGDVTIADGVAATRNLRMRGVQAAVLMEGSADLNRETQDLRVVVVPEINAGTASLAYAAINPAVGLGTFLAQLLLRRPLIAASTREFRVQGTWADPKIERVERKPGEAVPDIDAPAAPPPPKAAS
ncbi:MAG: YhdP family protein [Aquincola sp.]|nr:YhdP family protein [Aquincola sp.]